MKKKIFARLNIYICPKWERERERKLPIFLPFRLDRQNIYRRDETNKTKKNLTESFDSTTKKRKQKSSMYFEFFFSSFSILWRMGFFFVSVNWKWINLSELYPIESVLRQNKLKKNNSIPSFRGDKCFSINSNEFR